MRAGSRISPVPRTAKSVLSMVVLCMVAVAPTLFDYITEEFDSYIVRVEGFWVYSTPSGTLQGSADSGTVDLTKDLNFNSYSTKGAPVCKINPEVSKITFFVKASVSIDGTFDKWD